MQYERFDFKGFLEKIGLNGDSTVSFTDDWDYRGDDPETFNYGSFYMTFKDKAQLERAKENVKKIVDNLPEDVDYMIWDGGIYDDLGGHVADNYTTENWPVQFMRDYFKDPKIKTVTTKMIRKIIKDWLPEYQDDYVLVSVTIAPKF